MSLWPSVILARSLLPWRAIAATFLADCTDQVPASRPAVAGPSCARRRASHKAGARDPATRPEQLASRQSRAGRSQTSSMFFNQVRRANSHSPRFGPSVNCWLAVLERKGLCWSGVESLSLMVRHCLAPGSPSIPRRRVFLVRALEVTGSGGIGANDGFALPTRLSVPSQNRSAAARSFGDSPGSSRRPSRPLAIVTPVAIRPFLNRGIRISRRNMVRVVQPVEHFQHRGQ